MADKKSNLTLKVIIALIAGFVVGVALYEFGLGDAGAQAWIQSYLTEGIFLVIGKAFIAALKMMVVPLVLVSLVCGVCASEGGSDIGRMGGKTFVLYFITTAVAISIALTLANIVDPGAGAQLGEGSNYTPKEPPSLVQVLINIVPSNPLQAMTQGNMLQIIVFAILLGLSIKASGAAGERITPIFVDMNQIIMKMVMMVMAFAPYGVFCLVAKVFADKGLSFLSSLTFYVLTVMLALALHAVGTFSVLLKTLAKVNPVMFFRKMYPAMLYAFSTASSAATMPVTLRTTDKALGVKNDVASFTIPLGTTINMDGTAIMQGVATVFIASAYSIDLTVADFLTVILTATLASVGTAAVPGAGMITLAMVLIQVGLPAEAIGLIIGVDRILDMMRTSVNVAGDATVTTVIAVSEGKLDRSVFNDPARREADD